MPSREMPSSQGNKAFRDLRESIDCSSETFLRTISRANLHLEMSSARVRRGDSKWGIWLRTFSRCQRLFISAEKMKDGVTSGRRLWIIPPFSSSSSWLLRPRTGVLGQVSTWQLRLCNGNSTLGIRGSGGETKRAPFLRPRTLTRRHEWRFGESSGCE